MRINKGTQEVLDRMNGISETYKELPQGMRYENEYIIEADTVLKEVTQYMEKLESVIKRSQVQLDIVKQGIDLQMQRLDENNNRDRRVKKYMKDRMMREGNTR